MEGAAPTGVMSGRDPRYSRADRVCLALPCQPSHGRLGGNTLLTPAMSEGVQPQQRPSLEDPKNLQQRLISPPTAQLLLPGTSILFCSPHPVGCTPISLVGVSVGVPPAVPSRGAQPYDIHPPHLPFHSCVHAFIHSCNKYLLNFYCGLGSTVC